MQVAEFFTKSINPESPVDYGYSTKMLKGCTRLLWINRGGDDVDENLKPNMNNEAGIDALNRVLKLQEYAPKEWMQMGWDEGQSVLCKRQCRNDGAVARPVADMPVGYFCS